MNLLRRNIIKTSAFTALAFMVTSHTQAQLLKPEKEVKVAAYFNSSIALLAEDNQINDFKDDAGVKEKNVAALSSQVWASWCKAVLSKAQLPKASAVAKAKPALHHWDLIGEDPMPFYFIKKGTMQSNEKYPLFLNLHGSGPKDMELKANLYWASRYKDSPSYYFIPQIPNEKRYRWWFQPEQRAWEKLFRLAMASGEIDANKIYVLGISEGGYGSKRLGAYYADYLAGAGPMAGGEPLKNAPPLNFRNIAFSFQTGELDKGFGRNTNTQKAKDAFDSLSKANPGQFVHNIVLQPGKGHHVDYTVTTPWLVKYTRNPLPAHISWVLFPMHGRYRNSFYNIAIEKPLGIKEGDEFDRALFDIQFDKKHNTVTINASLKNSDLQKTKAIGQGSMAIYLNDKIIDPSQKVKIYYNGKRIFKGKVPLTLENLVESCALYGDPERIFPAKLSIML